MGNLKEIFGANLRRFREENGISQKDFAAMLKVQPSYLSQIESGQKGFSPESLSEAANVINCEPWELLKPPGDATEKTSVAPQRPPEIPSKLLERILSETENLRKICGKIPSDVLDALSAAASAGNEPLFFALREILGLPENKQATAVSSKKSV